MKVHGLPERFWIVTEPSPFSTMEDICFACTFERLMLQVRGGLNENEIVGIFDDETEAQRATARLLGDEPVRPQDAVAVEITVHVMVIPTSEDISARDLAQAAVEAVRNAVRQAEAAGFRHRLEDRVSLGAGTVELRNIVTTVG